MNTKVSGVQRRRSIGKFLPKRFGPIKTLLSCCMVIAVAVAISAGLVIYSTYRNRVDEVEAELSKLSSVLADHADRTFEALDLIERGVLAEYPVEHDATPETFSKLMSTASVHQRLRDKVASSPQLETLAILDSKGSLVNFSRSWPIPTANAADRDYFQAVSQSNSQDIYISKPVPSHITGTWSIYLARRVNSANGEFLGVIVAAMGMIHLEKFFSDLARRPGEAIVLARADGVLLARYPALKDKVGQMPSDYSVFKGTGRQQFHRLVSAWDGQERFVASTRSVDYPLLVNVSSTVSRSLARWKRQTGYLAGAVALLELCIGTVALVMCKELRGRLRLSQERAEKGRLIAEAELTLARERECAAEERSAKDRGFRVAIETMRQGLCMFDHDENMVIFNHRFAADLGLPFERLSPGLPLRCLVALLQEYGTIDAGGADRFSKLLAVTQPQCDTENTIETLLDGRILSCAVRALSQDKGWVLTCEDVTDRHKAEQRLVHISLHDPLTDLANRTALRNRVEAEVQRATPAGSALLYIDLDGFKGVNDTLGHPAGDAVLQTVAERLLKLTRTDDTAARVGGDEFVIVQAGPTSPARAGALAERLIEEIRVPIEVFGHHIEVGASIGIAFIHSVHVEPDLFIKNADLALYEAKKAGGNCFRRFDPDLETAASARGELCAELRAAVANQEFVVHY